MSNIKTIWRQYLRLLSDITSNSYSEILAKSDQINPSNMVGGNITSAQSEYLSTGRNFVTHYEDMARNLVADIKPQVRLNNLRDNRVAWTTDEIKRIEQNAFVVLGTELPNLLAALRWSRTNGMADVSSKIANDLGHFFYAQSYWTEWLDIAEDAVKDARIACSKATEAEALNLLGIVYRYIGRIDDAEISTSQSLEMYRRLDDRAGEALALGNLGGLQAIRGETMAARVTYDQSLAIFRELHDEYGQARALLGLGVCLGKEGDWTGAARQFEDCLTVERQIGHRFGEAQALQNLSVAQLNLGFVDQSRITAEASIQLKRELGDRQGMVASLSNLARILEQQGEIASSVAALTELVSIQTGLGLTVEASVQRRLSRLTGEAKPIGESGVSTIDR